MRQRLRLGQREYGNKNRVARPSTVELSRAASLSMDRAISTFLEAVIKEKVRKITVTCVENQWLVADLEFAWKHLYRVPRFHALEEIMLALIAYPHPIPLGDFIDRSEFLGNGTPYSEHTVALDVIHYMSDRAKKAECMISTRDGRKLGIRPEALAWRR